MTNHAQWVAAQYEQASHPLFPSRSDEFEALRRRAEHFNIELTEQDFDWGIAMRFGGGIEYDGWTRL
ncbi:hypothetical protein [Streptomyces sp. MP131-18]|uniref:hypothetical protein n=1 Tax=Streptomyces sp. MP131-18 TaxID=1857892 RepID=UPI00097BCD15|nr:hypothetical protein [Streptomyces sp. MP131-18]ONK13244.1 hypothetical protein STBA_40070 [Streptomyces sp. MP131-18]